MLRVLLLTLCISLWASSTTIALAENSKKSISSQQAASVVKKRYGGTVLKVQKDKSAYKVKIVKPNGQVISKKVNATTGKIEKN